MMRWPLVVAPVLLVACGPSVTPVRGPDGDEWLSIDCGRSKTTCEWAAGDACPRGYIVADNEGHTDVVMTSGYAASKWTGHLLIKCRTAQAASEPATPQVCFTGAKDGEKRPACFSTADECTANREKAHAAGWAVTACQ